MAEGRALRWALVGGVGFALACGAKSELVDGALGADAGNERVEDAGPDVTVIDASRDIAIVDVSQDIPPLDAPADQLVVDVRDADASDAMAPCPPVKWPEPLATTPVRASTVTCSSEPWDPACGLSSCGNGVIDECGGLREECDSASPGQTCQSLGYLGGQLGCKVCTLERWRCSDCIEGGDVLACGLGFRYRATGFGLAAGNGRVALATIGEAEAGIAGNPQVDLFAPDLSPTGHVCLGVAGAVGVDIARRPGGWALAVDTSDGVAVYELDEAGQALTGVLVAGASYPKLVERPAGPPLLAYELGNAFHLSWLGAGAWTSEVFDYVYAGAPYDAVFIGDAFLVAARRQFDPAGVHVARVELDGRVTCINGASHDRTEYPSLSWDGVRGRLTWADFSNPLDVVHAFVSESAEVTTPTGLGAVHFNPAPVLSSGTGSLVVLGSHTGGVYVSKTLTLARLDAAGNETSRQTFVDNPGAVSGHRVVALDDVRAVVGYQRHAEAWGKSEGVGLAVVRR